MNMSDAVFPDWRGYDRVSLDHAYSPSQIAKDFHGDLARYADQTMQARGAGYRQHAYGSGPRQLLDIYLPPGPADSARPIHVFIHGGFWQALSKDYAGFAAPAFNNQDVIFVALNYTLAPQASLAAIIGEIRQALDWVVAQAASFNGDAKRILVSGHSAGGYLAASLIAGAFAEQHGPAPIAGLLPISGVYDLPPIAACYVNDALGLDAAETARLDLLTARPLLDIPVHLAVGQDESAEFRRQSLQLQAAWSPVLRHCICDQRPGRDHFDILFELSTPGAPLHAAAMAMLA